MSTTFNDFLEVLKDSVFEERPVDVKTFVESPNYLGQPQLSEIQYNIVEAMSQIYYKKDLEDLMGTNDGGAYYDKYTKLLTLLLMLNRLRMFSLKDLKQRLKDHLGLQENFMQKQIV